jgi:hypothetical protein
MDSSTFSQQPETRKTHHALSPLQQIALALYHSGFNVFPQLHNNKPSLSLAASGQDTHYTSRLRQTLLSSLAKFLKVGYSRGQIARKHKQPPISKWLLALERSLICFNSAIWRSVQESSAGEDHEMSSTVGTIIATLLS